MASSAEAAAHIDLSRVSFAELIAKGIINKPSERRAYNLDEVRLAYIRHMRKIASGRGGGADADRLTAERAALTAAKRRREERQDEIEAGQVARLSLVRRHLEQTLLVVRDRLLNVPGETAYLLALRPQAECFEIVNGAIRTALEEIADPAGAAARAADAGTETDDAKSKE